MRDSTFILNFVDCLHYDTFELHYKNIAKGDKRDKTDLINVYPLTYYRDPFALAVVTG